MLLFDYLENLISMNLTVTKDFYLIRVKVL